jgi:hypothetical protein
VSRSWSYPRDDDYRGDGETAQFVTRRQQTPPVVLDLCRPIDASKIYDMSEDNVWGDQAAVWLDTRSAAVKTRTPEDPKSRVPEDAKKCFGHSSKSPTTAPVAFTQDSNMKSVEMPKRHHGIRDRQGRPGQADADERVRYYNEVCRSMGLNPLTQPFSYITLNGKLTLYATRACADQLRKVNGVSLEIVSREICDDVLTVHVRARLPDGRVDEDLGSVYFPSALKGEARANAELKGVTKAKRRATLSICGLGWLDETEIADIPAKAKRPARNVMLPAHNAGRGEIEEALPVTGAATYGGGRIYIMLGKLPRKAWSRCGVGRLSPPSIKNAQAA